MDKIIKECINDYIKNRLIMEYNTSNNEVISNDIHNLLNLLDKFRKELIDDVNTRHTNGEMVSRNEAIIRKTEIDINNLINDLNHLI